MVTKGISKKDRPGRWERKILRRPLSVCQTTKYDVGLLRMTAVIDLSFWGSDSHKNKGFKENTLLHGDNAMATEESPA